MIKVHVKLGKKDLFLILGMVVFIVMTYLFANFVLLPDLMNYVALKERYSFQKNIQKYLQQNSQDAKIEYETLKQYKPFLEHMRHFDQEKLQKILKTYFSAVKIEKVDIAANQESKVQHRIYQVDVVMKDTRDFFQLLHDIKSEGLPIRIETPIAMKKSKEGIEATFILHTYSL